LSLAGVPLLQKTALGFEPRSAREIEALAKSAYGANVEPARWLPGLGVVAKALNRGDLGRAMIAALQLRLTELDWGGAIRVAHTDDALAKYDPNEPRDWRGRWTTGGGAAGSAAPKPGRPAPPPDAANDNAVGNGAQPGAGRGSAGEGSPEREVRPETLTHVGVEEGEVWSGRNRPSGVIDDLKDVFPSWFPDTPITAILAPIDGVLDLSGPGEAANEAATRSMRDYLIAQIKAINPHYVFESFDPGGMPSTWQGRTNLINDLLAQRAAALYKFRGETRPLQVETLRFLQRRVDVTYPISVKRFNDGKLKQYLNPEEAIGNDMDRGVRQDLKDFYNYLGIPWGQGQQVRINNRDYDTSSGGKTYKIPDARVADVAFDVTLTPKTPGSAQVRGTLSSDAKPSALIVVRPSQLGRGSTYLIGRPSARLSGV
jgi:hypothetical protein